jgi:hypothetical protein
MEATWQQVAVLVVERKLTTYIKSGAVFIQKQPHFFVFQKTTAHFFEFTTHYLIDD